MRLPKDCNAVRAAREKQIDHFDGLGVVDDHVLHESNVSRGGSTRGYFHGGGA